MGEAGFEGIRKLVTRRQNTVVQYIAAQPILDLCEQSTWQPGARVYCWWCKQAGIYLEGAKKRVAEAGTVLESEVEAELDVELKEDSGG